MSGSVNPSERLNMVDAPKMLAICSTAVIDERVIGKTDSGRAGEHSGRYSFLLDVGAYSASAARQNINLKDQTVMIPNKQSFLNENNRIYNL